MQNLETRMDKYEDQLNVIIDRLDQISGQIVAFRGDTNIFQKQERGYLNNITRQVYDIRKTLDMSEAYKKCEEQEADNSNIHERVYLNNITRQVYEIKKALDMAAACKKGQREWEDDSHFG